MRRAQEDRQACWIGHQDHIAKGIYRIPNHPSRFTEKGDDSTLGAIDGMVITVTYLDSGKLVSKEYNAPQNPLLTAALQALMANPP
jgi:hypothetical protein